MTGLAEALALREREELVRRDREHESLTTIFVMEDAVDRLEVPPSVPFRRPCLRKTFERRAVAYLHRRAFDHDVETSVPGVAASEQRDARVLAQVDGLLFVGTSREVDDAVQPHGDERCGVRTAVGAHRREPEQLGAFECATGVVPPSGDRVRIAESWVQGRSRFGHRSVSLLYSSTPAPPPLRSTPRASPFELFQIGWPIPSRLPSLSRNHAARSPEAPEDG